MSPAAQEVHEAALDLQAAMGAMWREKFPDGKLPDDLAAEVYQMPRKLFARMAARSAQPSR